MSFQAKAPQVQCACDGCGTCLEHDGIRLYFDANTAARDVEDYDWKVVDGKVLCDECVDILSAELEAELPEPTADSGGLQ